MNWDPVADTGGSQASGAAPTGARSDFQFDLGGALARLGLDAPTIEGLVDTHGPTDLADADDDPLPRRTPPSAADPPSMRQPPTVQPAPDPLPVRQPRIEPAPAPPVAAAPVPPPAPDPLPVRRPAAEHVARTDDPLPTRPVVESAPAAPAPVDQEAPAQTVASRHSTQRRSVFDEKAAAPTLPSVGTVTPAPQPAPTAQPAPALPAQTPLPGGAVPTLPAVNPAPTPMVVKSIDSAPSTPDITALRSAQLRASRNQRQGKLFGRSLLAFLLIGALIAVALVFGRAYLFPAEWDPSLTPIVDEVQQSRGSDFDDTVPLVVQEPAAYTQNMIDLTLGTGWAERLPEWRALGIAGPDVNVDSVAAQVADFRNAVYDPSTDTIYQRADVDRAVAAADLRFALESAFARQSGGSSNVDVVVATPSGFLGVSPSSEVIQQAVDRTVAGVVDAVSADVGSLPLPIGYEVRAIQSLGGPLLAGGRVDPASLQLGDQYPDAIYSLLDDNPTNTATGLLLPGDRGLADPVALGTDDWSLVWGARLPSETVDLLVEIVIADSYRPVDRDGTTCFIGVFESASEADAASVLVAMSSWAAGAPAEAAALATAIDATRVQLEGCDPGDATVAPDAASVEALITRQIARLSG